VAELRSYFRPASPGQAVRAIPGEGLDVPIWILGSSDFGARLAAELGLPFAFASHFAPALLDQAVEIYRRTFRPSDRLARPRLMLGVNVVAADSDGEAALLLTSIQQAFVNLRTGRPTRLPPPAPGYAERLSPQQAAVLDGIFACAAVGSPDTVRARLETLRARTDADELILTAQIYDHAARLRSFEIAAALGV
jgi:luciferase family oxidoreductase group 1